MGKPHLNFDLIGNLAESVDMSLPAMQVTDDIMVRKIKFLTLDSATQPAAWARVTGFTLLPIFVRDSLNGRFWQ